MLVIFLVQESIWKARVLHRHQVMETHTHMPEQYTSPSRALVLEDSETLETVCKYAKRILHNSWAARQPAVEDALLVSHVTLGKALH